MPEFAPVTTAVRSRRSGIWAAVHPTRRKLRALHGRGRAPRDTGAMVAQAIRTRVWRNGKLEKEDFPFEQVSDYLAEPDCMVWADLLCPDDETVDQLAEEL